MPLPADGQRHVRLKQWVLPELPKAAICGRLTLETRPTSVLNFTSGDK
jgi:hypothetical protein